MEKARYPALYEINTRVWLRELSAALGRPASLDDVADAALDQIAALGFDWVWLLGVWQTGKEGQRVSLTQPQWRQEYRALLPDFQEADVSGSPFAVREYAVHADFGGRQALYRFRQKLRQRGLRLLLDFVPNHTARDHPWVRSHPEFYLHGDEATLAREPLNFCRLSHGEGPALILAHGRDPYFPAWPDTLQLNYRHPGLRKAMIGELLNVAGLCDGVRCDMAMLLLPDIFVRTWGNASLPRDGVPPVDSAFWPEAIARVREKYPQFLFLAEVYWDLERTLHQQGFAYTYDKRLYDRLLSRDAETVRGHLGADPAFQARSMRFLENHDEPRAASVLPWNVHQAAAAVTFLVPGLRFFHEGQLEGRRVKASVHLRRRPAEPTDPAIHAFYLRLAECLKRPEVRNGCWRLLECRPAWEGNPTWQRFLAFTWEDGGASRGGKRLGDVRLLVTVNYGPTRGQCSVALPWASLASRKVLLRDLLSPARYVRDGNDLICRGLYLDMPEWGYHVFEVVDVGNT